MGLVIHSKSILNVRPWRILNIRSRGVHQPMGVAFAGGRQGALQGPLGIALISTLGAVSGERAALITGIEGC